MMLEFYHGEAWTVEEVNWAVALHKKECSPNCGMNPITFSNTWLSYAREIIKDRPQKEVLF